MRLQIILLPALVQGSRILAKGQFRLANDNFSPAGCVIRRLADTVRQEPDAL
jgi:hypothetical protein